MQASASHEAVVERSVWGRDLNFRSNVLTKSLGLTVARRSA